MLIIIDVVVVIILINFFDCFVFYIMREHFSIQFVQFFWCILMAMQWQFGIFKTYAVCCVLMTSIHDHRFDFTLILISNCQTFCSFSFRLSIYLTFMVFHFMQIFISRKSLHLVKVIEIIEWNWLYFGGKKGMQKVVPLTHFHVRDVYPGSFCAPIHTNWVRSSPFRRSSSDKT